MNHSSTIITGFVDDETESKTHTEGAIEIEAVVKSASHKLPVTSETKYSAVTQCFHTTCGGWFNRENKSVDTHSDALNDFLETLSYDPGVANRVTYVAVVESETVTDSHYISVYKVGNRETPELITTETCENGFNPVLDLKEEFGLTHHPET